jgi:hypothetical protein
LYPVIALRLLSSLNSSRVTATGAVVGSPAIKQQRGAVVVAEIDLRRRLGVGVRERGAYESLDSIARSR